MKETTASFRENQGQKASDAIGGTCGKAGAADRGDPLLYLYSNNTDGHLPLNSQEENTSPAESLASVLSPYCKKQALILSDNVYRLINYVGIEKVGFLTLTFKDNVTDPKEAYRRFDILRKCFLSKYSEFGIWLCVKERQKRGSLHFHLLIELKGDIQTGFDWDALANGNYKHISTYLRQIWKDLREACEKYGFGRSELLPVKSNAEAMRFYLGKYISKDFGNRTSQDKGMRKVTYSRDWPKSSVKLSWNNHNSQLWRGLLQKFAEYLGCSEMYQLTEVLGPGWAYRFAPEIVSTDYLFELADGNSLSDHSPAARIEMTCLENRRRREKEFNLVSHKTNRQKISETGKQKVAQFMAEYTIEKDLFRKEINRCKRLPEAPF
jgi:hypothetical protein